MKRDQGFSLMEMSLVLLIVSIFLLLPLLHFQSVTKQQEITTFVDRLVEDLHYTQQLALTRNRSARLYIQPDNHRYRVMVANEIVKQVEVPEYVIFSGSTIRPDQIIFNRNGNLSYSGSFEVYADHARFQFTFLIGSGRFYYVRR
ncbi:competence type IV pilus minor pilin ComGD [Geomicrobium sp. JCM 19039]|uniref:competence type IV pilus minor pilin ComGD n=1 Tax=Geomicrobium sp. JCM 19039 TaxID=1460636 RepID=UPI00210122DD|nr:competence type IV pilus minor pilin ComGD [Geomicrobium sp. JCM 19039]